MRAARSLQRNPSDSARFAPEHPVDARRFPVDRVTLRAHRISRYDLVRDLLRHALHANPGRLLEVGELRRAPLAARGSARFGIEPENPKEETFDHPFTL